MSRFVDLDERVTAQFYDQECEEWTMQTVTIEDVLDSVCDEYTVLPSAQFVTDINVGDTVSRRAAIDIVRNRVKRFTTACVLAVTELEQLPPAQPRMTCDGCKYANHPTGWSDVCVLCIRNFRNFTDRYEGESDGKN